MIRIQKFTFNPVGENTYVLYDETGECVIIDPGMYDGEEQNILVKFVRDTNLKPVLLLNTHCHYDHVFGNKFVFDNWGLKPQFHRGELFVLQAIPGVGIGRQLGADHEQLALEPQDQLGKLSCGQRPTQGSAGKAERGDGFIGRAVGVRSQVRLAHSGAAEKEAGGAVVALLCVDAHVPRIVTRDGRYHAWWCNEA